MDTSLSNYKKLIFLLTILKILSNTILMSITKQNNKLSRNMVLDNIRGIAFLLMVIHHIFYFYDITNNTDYSNYVNIFGIISRNIFIFLVGISLVYSYDNNNNNFIYSRIIKSIEILIHAFLITLLTYNYYPDEYIRFGVLHCIGVISLLLIVIVPYKKIYIMVFLISLLLQNIQLPSINNFIDTILGPNISHYNTIDWFPIITWAPVVLLGMIVGSKNYKFNINILNNYNFLTWIGQNCLILYTLHIYILVFFYQYIKN